MSSIKDRITFCGTTRIPTGSRIQVTGGKYQGQTGLSRQPIPRINTPMPKGFIGIIFDDGGTGSLPEIDNVRISEIEVIK